MAEEDQVRPLSDVYIQKRVFWPMINGMWTVIGLILSGFAVFFVFNLQSNNDLRERVNAAIAEGDKRSTSLEIRVSDLRTLEDAKISALEQRVVTIKELEAAIDEIEKWQANNDRIIEGRDAIQCNDIRHVQVAVNAVFAIIAALAKQIEGLEFSREFTMLPVTDCAPGAGTR